MELTARRKRVVSELRGMVNPFVVKIQPLFLQFGFDYHDNGIPTLGDLRKNLNGLIDHVAQETKQDALVSSGRLAVGYELDDDGGTTAIMRMEIDADDII